MNRCSVGWLVMILGVLAASCGTRYGDPVGRSSSGGGGGASSLPDAGGGDATAPGSTDGSVDGSSGADGSHPPAHAIALPEFCTADGWCGTNLTFSAVWGTRADDLWVVAKGLGDNTTASAVLHWDGRGWTAPIGQTGTYYTSEQSDLEAIWGTGPADVWIAGSCGNLLHWNGADWKESYVGCNSALKAIWGSGPNDIWAVGDAGAIHHFDGTTWVPLGGPYVPLGARPQTFTVDLKGIWGSGASDVWAVGDAGVILHWDGAAWSPYQDAVGGTATTANLQAVWGSGAGDVWAVGAAGTVLRSNGAVWSLATERIPSTRNLNQVWGSGASDVWVAGDAGTLLHFTGDAWYTAPGKTAEALLDVWGIDGELWAVGERGAAVHWDRAAWAATPPRPVRDDLFAAFARRTDDVWVGGAGGGVAHWDGSSWEQAATGAGDINGIWLDGREGTAAFMVGDGGKILLCTTFERIPTCSNWGKPGDPDFKAVWGAGTGADDVWIGGAGGALRHWLNSQLIDVASPTTATVRSIWGGAPDDVWAATASDAVLHWDGLVWMAMSVPGGGNTGTSWRVVAGTGATDVWLAGTTSFSAYKAGGAYSVNARWNGSSWSKPVAPTPSADPTFSTGAWALGPSDLWVVSPGPYPLPTTLTPQDTRAIRRWDGVGWTGSPGGSRANLSAIAGTGDELWAVGAAGTILHRHVPDRASR